MLFKDIKQNYPVFILDKQELKFIQGKVISTSFPHIDMNMKTAMNTAANQMVVDITIDVNGNTATYVIPENLSITSSGNLILSTDRDGLIREIEAMKNAAEQIISNVDYQKNIIEKSTVLLAELNPIYKKEIETEERFSKIENSFYEMNKKLDEFIKGFKDKNNET